MNRYICKIISAALLALFSTVVLAGSGSGTVIGYVVGPYDNDGSGSNPSADYVAVSLNDPNYTDSSSQCYIPYLGYMVFFVKIQDSIRGQAGYSAVMAASASGASIFVNYSVNSEGNCEVTGANDNIAVIN